MEQSFARMDEEVQNWSQSNQSSTCRCKLQTPHCDAVGSTAVVAVIAPNKIIVSNYGDSQAVLCRNSIAVPLSSDLTSLTDLKSCFEFKLQKDGSLIGMVLGFSEFWRCLSRAIGFLEFDQKEEEEEEEERERERGHKRSYCSN